MPDHRANRRVTSADLRNSVGNRLESAFRGHLESALRAYAGVLFCTSPRLGAWLAAITWCAPRAAAAGTLALLASMLWARLFSLEKSGEGHLVNSLLAGLCLGAFHAFDSVLAGWLLAASLLTTLLTHALAGPLWQLARLPVLSLPFVLGSWAVSLGAHQSFSLSMTGTTLNHLAGPSFGSWGDAFFTALGWLLLVPYPLAGALIFAGLIAASRYLALLALAGYLAGQLVIALLAHGDTQATGFNFMLASMALGGTFAVPGRLSFAVALGGGALAAALVLMLAAPLGAQGLSLLTLPFILAVYLWLAALGSRVHSGSLQLRLAHPGDPESAFAAERLGRARGLAGDSIDSIPLAVPFYGEWQVTQGFDGEHTHQASWQHALDFEIFADDAPGSGNGDAREDYFCFGAPVLAPAAGTVVATVDHLPDCRPGEADLANNWGNHVLIRTAGGVYVLLAHLRQHSLCVQPGAWVTVGERIAACGSSGRSPVPHLHLQVQSTAALGSPTLPFHLVNVIVRQADAESEFRLCHRPTQGEAIAGVQRDEVLAQAMVPTVGMATHYRLPSGGQASLRAELTLLGQARLHCDNGTQHASCAFDGQGASLAAYDRQGPRSPLLDTWLLALGLSALSSAAQSWRDAPALELWPLAPWQRALVALLYPLGAAGRSHYQRHWDLAEQCWRIDGTHHFTLLPGLRALHWQATTHAWVAPGQGVRRLHVSMDDRCWLAHLESPTH
ncbi:MAG: urea transporter [Rhodocyclaceae bacterium]|nr:urea transporter [Rhodocyclaceae bacterium]MBK6908950.1 urea transporter [Rhodocyclaceae bacterium]